MPTFMQIFDMEKTPSILTIIYTVLLKKIEKAFAETFGPKIPQNLLLVKISSIKFNSLIWLDGQSMQILLCYIIA